MSLTCLVCQTLVYRVLQVITPDIDYGEGPVPPTEDWVESELLKTPSGWIEVYQDCIVSGLASHFPCVKEGRACPSATMWSFPLMIEGMTYVANVLPTCIQTLASFVHLGA